jgi:hypothetical protein
MLDLTFLPISVQNAAVFIASGDEVMWPYDDAAAAIAALAAAGRVILGIDLRSDGHNVHLEKASGLATEIPWSSFDPSVSATPVEDGHRAALEALNRPGIAKWVADGYSWVLVTWKDN